MQIGPLREPCFTAEFCGFIGVSHSVFSGPASALQTAPTKAAPRTSPNHFSYMVFQNLAMARFSSGVACLRRHSACRHAGRMASDLVHHGQSFDDQLLGFGTLAIHLGNGVDAETGAIRRPITLANAYALPYDASALAIAKHLESLDVVRFVAYPGLESHLHHEVAASQLARPDSGFGGVLSFGLDTDHDGHNRFVSKLNVITSAVSLGHDQSLIVFLGEDDERQYLYPPEFHRGFFRLAVGLEDTDDLIRDIDHALAEAGFEV